MVLFVIVTALGVLFTVLLAIHSENTGYSWHGCLSIILATILGVASGVAIIVLMCTVFYWKSAEVKASLINREYKTNYTQAEIFYASDVIDTIRELDRTRVELNGNIMEGK